MKTYFLKSFLYGMLLFTLTNCGTLYQSADQTQVNYSQLPSGLSKSFPYNTVSNSTNIGAGWQHLMIIGPGSDALITFTDGTLRGGTIVEVRLDVLIFNTAGMDMTLSRTDIALIEIKRSSGALAGGLIGFLISGVDLLRLYAQKVIVNHRTGL